MPGLTRDPVGFQQNSLWDEAQTPHAARWETIPVHGGELILIRNWLGKAKADCYFQALNKLVQWQQSTIRIAGRSIPIPRLNAWYGDAGTAYQYSGIRFQPLPWNRPLATLKERVQSTLAKVPPASFAQRLRINSALVNCYRHGQDSVAWHADNEKELGPAPQIASVSLGASRRFLLRRRPAVAKAKREATQTSKLELTRSVTRDEKIELILDHGSLLFMLGDLQRHWLHCIPKTRTALAARINITFREVINPAIP